MEPRAWRTITYGKGSWIMQMLRGRMGDERFLAMLAEVCKRYDRKEITTEEFRALAARFLPPKSDDPKLETFFGQWVYGTGIPTVKMTYSVKGVAPNVKVVGTVTQSGVDEDFTALVPVEIQIARGKSVVQWVRTSETPATFTVALKAAPLKVVAGPALRAAEKEGNGALASGLPRSITTPRPPCWHRWSRYRRWRSGWTGNAGRPPAPPSAHAR